MSSKYLIRKATLEDIDRIVAMRLRLQNHLMACNSKVWQLSEKRIAGLPMFYKSALEDHRCHLVVAEERESSFILGMGLGRIQKHEELVPNKSGKIDDIWVEPNYRQKGLCKKIVSELITFFKSNGIDTMVLNYVIGNLEAEAVWRRFGFLPVLTTGIATRADVHLKCRNEKTQNKICT